ncbi:MAG: hypothetical protein AAF702_25325 [Chloroflexota bacterium]
MSKVKNKVVLAVAGLALALIIGATSDGIELGTNGKQASEVAPVEMMQLAADSEDATGGG